MTLGEQQRLFAELTGRFITAVYQRGYHLSFGEAWRPPETAALYAQQGRGIANSLHGLRLAIDWNLFGSDGAWLKTVEAYRPIGEFWESLHELCRWGGRFKGADGAPKPDAPHFSLERDGVK